MVSCGVGLSESLPGSHAHLPAGIAPHCKVSHSPSLIQVKQRRDSMWVEQVSERIKISVLEHVVLTISILKMQTKYRD